MLKLLTPIFAFLIAIGIIITYVRPTFLSIKNTQEELKNYREAITKAGELQRLLEEKDQQRRSFSQVDTERLEAMIANDVHVVSRLIDLDALARAHNMKIFNIQTGVDFDQRDPSRRAAVAKQAAAADTAPALDPLLTGGAIQEDRPIASYVQGNDISFTLSGTYEDLRNFLERLEESLVLTDVVSLSFTRSEGDLMEFNLTVRFYSYNARTE